MNKVTIIYWSGTGNTKAMADAIKEGAEKEGVEVKLLEVSEASQEDVINAEAVAFGCPAMGAEELEETVMRPFMDEANGNISGKKVALFGSYEWANGEWMQYWQEEVEGTGANLIADGLIAYDNPDEDALEECQMLGRDLARA